MCALVWSPIYRFLEEKIRGGDGLTLLIVPFIKRDALRRLVDAHKDKTKLRVVVRWRPEDLSAGVSDLDVYNDLKAIGASLYVNNDIHLKLYIFDSNRAFSASGNVTSKGLGYSENANLEVGALVQLTADDWVNIYSLVATSRLVDDEIYARYRVFLEEQPKAPKPVLRPLVLPDQKKHTISSLPATETPAELTEFYFAKDYSRYTDEEIRRATHDIAVFRIPSNLDPKSFDRALGDAFSSSPFVVDFIETLKQQRSIHFGGVNAWIHQKCEDVPLPFRWAIKENTHIFYDWLVRYIPDVTWDTPNHSQVIYWRKGKG